MVRATQARQEATLRFRRPMWSWLKAFSGRPAIGGGGPTSATNDDGDRRGPHAFDSPAGWIAVDLDGTLAEYTEWRGMDHIGRPVPLMKKRVLEWLEAGYVIKIMTARATLAGGVDAVKKWLTDHGLPALAVTNQKDFEMIELWDDRAIQVVANTGKPVIRPSQSSRPKVPLFSGEQAGETFESARVKRLKTTDASAERE